MASSLTICYVAVNGGSRVGHAHALKALTAGVLGYCLAPGESVSSPTVTWGDEFVGADYG